MACPGNRKKQGHSAPAPFPKRGEHTIRPQTLVPPFRREAVPRQAGGWPQRGRVGRRTAPRPPPGQVSPPSLLCRKPARTLAFSDVCQRRRQVEGCHFLKTSQSPLAPLMGRGGGRYLATRDTKKKTQPKINVFRQFFSTSSILWSTQLPWGRVRRKSQLF